MAIATIDPKSQVKPKPPPDYKVIMVYVDQASALLCIKPRGELEALARNEISRLLHDWAWGPGQPAKHPELVEETVRICEAHGWERFKTEPGREVLVGSWTTSDARTPAVYLRKLVQD